MAKTVDKFKVELTGDASGLKRTMANVSRSFEGLGRKMRGVGVAMSAALTAPIGLVGKSFLGAASDAQEMESKFNAVFKGNAAEVKAWAEAYGNAVGRSTQSLQEMASSVQDTFVPMGFARDEAAQMSKQITALAVDVASFNNASDADAMRDFQSALVGNHETVRKYGIIITQAVLDQELLNMGVKDGVKNATEAEKVQARLNLILKGTTDAQGDAARTSSSYANQVKGLKGEFQELAVQMGEIFMPMAAKVVGWARGAVAWFKSLDDGTKMMIVSVGGFAAALGPLVLALSGAATVIAAMMSPLGLTIAAVAAAGTIFYHFRDDIAEATKPIVKIITTYLVEPIQKILKFLREKIGGFVSWYIGVWAKLADLAGLDGIAETLKGVQDAVKNFADGELDVSIKDIVLKAGSGAVGAIKARFDEVLGVFHQGLAEMPDIGGGLSGGAGGSGSGAKLFADGFDPYKWAAGKRSGEEAAKKINDAFKGAFDGAGDALADFISSGKEGFDSLRDWASSTADSILKAFTNQAIQAVFSAIFGGGTGGGSFFSFGGGKAGGGRISAPTLVGERGPELFVPDGAGTIRNAHDTRGLMGGGVTVHQSIVNRFDVGLEAVDQRVALAAPKIAQSAQAGLFDAMKRGGSPRRAMGV